MTITAKVVNSVIRGLTTLMCRVDDAQLARVPAQGPLIIVANHINFVETPIVYTRLLPRPLTGFVKSENWDNPALRFLFELWGAIPLRRGEPDRTAFRQAIAALEQGKILAIAPEGTRSGHGRLQRGKAGVVMLALASGAPLLPLVYFGGENLWPNLRRLRRTDFHIVVGQPFQLRADGRVSREVRQQMIDEIMYQLAALLPPYNRGHYADLAAATETYLRFPGSSQSNLRRAEAPATERIPNEAQALPAQA